MQGTVTKTSELLRDPRQIALLRELYAHARHVRAEHATYTFAFGAAPQEHTWTVGNCRVSYEDGWLRYLTHGHPLLKVYVGHVREAAQVLAAIGVLPQRFIGGAL